MARLLVDITPLRVSPAYRRLWLGNTLSYVGTQLTLVAVSLEVFALTGSSFAVGLLGLAALVPLAIIDRPGWTLRAPAAPAAPGGAAPGVVSINTADVAELTTLSGIGEATAAAIVAHREANGPFATVDQLTDVKGIGPAKLEALRDQVGL